MAGTVAIFFIGNVCKFCYNSSSGQIIIIKKKKIIPSADFGLVRLVLVSSTARESESASAQRLLISSFSKREFSITEASMRRFSQRMRTGILI